MKRLLLFAITSFFPVIANAYSITSYLEMVVVSSVSNTWQTLSLDNTYTNPVVACTYHLISDANVEGSVRVRILGSAIQVRVQRPLNGDATPSDVYCTISEEGSYTTPIKYEAHTVESSGTNRTDQWQISRTENVTSAKLQTYTNPVVTGQVMSDNDVNYVTFWSNACNNRNDPAINASICVGKHTGESNISTEFTETLGYFIAEQAEYTLVNGHVKIALGNENVRGVSDSPPYNYSLPRTYTFATATIATMNGGDGGWAVLYGVNPVGDNIGLAIEEDTVIDDERQHTREHVAYWVMQPIAHPELSLQKTISTIYDPFNNISNPKAIPGSVLEYTVTGRNAGDAPADNNSIVITDLISENTRLCVADVDNCLAPYFTDGTPSSGLSLTTINYSNNNASSFAYSVVADAGGTDSNVTNFQATTTGSFLPLTGGNATNFSINFRVLVE